MDTSTEPPALPADLAELKRPALVQLCKQWDVKAVGKNTDLVDKLLEAQAQSTHGQQVASCESATAGEDTSMSASSSPEPATDESVTAAAPDLTNTESAAPLEEADCTMPGAFVLNAVHASPSKRQRSPSPHDQHEATVPMETAEAIPSSSPRKLAGLPRKSVAPATFAYIPPVPVSNIKTSTDSPGLYPALPSTGTEVADNVEEGPAAIDHSVPQFTFTCPFGGVSVSSSSSLPASASVLQQLNARLAASGVPPATLSSSSTRPTLSHSPSASSLLRSKSSNELAAPKGAERFERAHQKQWSKTGSIAEHWSLGRKGGRDRSVSSTQSPEQEGSRKKRAKVEGQSNSIASTASSRGAVSKQSGLEKRGVGSATMIKDKPKTQTAPLVRDVRDSSSAVKPSELKSKAEAARRPLPGLAIRKPRSSLGSALLSKGTIKTPFVAKLYEKSRSRNACGPRPAQEAQKGEAPKGSAKALQDTMSALPLTDGKENAPSRVSGHSPLQKSDGTTRPAHSLSAKSSLAASSSVSGPSSSTSSRPAGSSSFHPYARPAQPQARRPGVPSTPATLNALRVLETKRRAAEESRRKIVEARATAAAGKSVALNALAAK